MNTTIAIALLASLLLFAACRSPELPTAGPQSPPNPAPAAMAQQAGEQPEAHLSTPDPTRDAMVGTMTARLRDRITDLTYLAAVGRLAAAAPSLLPDHIAHRDNHNECLTDTHGATERITQPNFDAQDEPDLQEQMTATLVECLGKEQAPWSEAEVQRRAAWLRPILDAAARSHNSAEHYALFHPDPTASSSFVEMATVFRQCSNLSAPEADRVALHDEGAAATVALEQAVWRIGNCMGTATAVAWPD